MILLLIVANLVPLAASWSNATMQASFMRRCIELAVKAQEEGAQPYGALIADPASATVVAEGYNAASRNPLWHGETAAIQNLSSTGVNVYEVAPKLELYTTAEPCAMCMSAISWSGFGAVYYGTSIPFIESQGAPQIDIRAVDVLASSTTLEHNTTVVGGVLNNETDPLYTACGEHCQHRNHGHDQDHDHDYGHDYGHDNGHRDHGHGHA
jgi:tRNA(Arg) A34 adenosine deaminase TadA